MSKKKLLVLALTAGSVGLTGTPAWAASGYGPVSPTGPSGSPGGYTNVVAARTVSAGGGGLNARLSNATVSITVPAGATSHPITIDVTAPRVGGINAGLRGAGLGRFTAVTGVGVKILNQDGSAFSGTLAKPMVVRVSAGGIGVGDRAVFFTSATHAVGLPLLVSGHTATFMISRDPNIAILQPKARHNPFRSPTTTVSFGSRSAAVQWVQWAVGVATDGAFGPRTRAAVETFQARHHLNSDGIVGPMTRGALSAVTR